MRHTILIATLSSVVASVVTTVLVSGILFGPGTASSASTPVEAAVVVSPGSAEGILQGDLNCDGIVDTHDTLGGLRFLGELDVPQNEPCPDVGTLAAIPGPAGPQGPPGPQGGAGPAGPPGISGLELVFTESAVDSEEFKFTHAFCPEGKQVLGGGVSTAVSANPSHPDLSAFALDSVPDFNLGFWFGQVREITPTAEDWGFTVFAVCATVAE